jgi:hypothetical protein
MTTLLSDPTFPSPDGFINDGFHADLALASKPLICAINAGVEQRVFGLQPGPIRSDSEGGPDYVFIIGNSMASSPNEFTGKLCSMMSITATTARLTLSCSTASKEATSGCLRFME